MPNNKTETTKPAGDKSSPSTAEALRNEIQAKLKRSEKLEDPKVTSPELSKLDRREMLLKKVKQYRADQGNSRKVTGGRSDKDYVWINKHELRRAAFEGQDYQVCKDPNVKSRWKMKDGTHICGDLILYEVSREWREVLDAHAELTALEAVEGSQEELLAFAARNKIPVTQLDTK